MSKVPNTLPYHNNYLASYYFLLCSLHALAIITNKTISTFYQFYSISFSTWQQIFDVSSKPCKLNHCIKSCTVMYATSCTYK